MLASVITDEVGGLLNDMEPGFEHVRWPLSDLLVYLTEAIAAIAQAKPSTFITVNTLTLQPGATQQLPDQFARLVNLHYNINADGTQGPAILPGVYTLQQAFPKPGCGYSAPIQSFAPFPGSERYFYVDPPVAAGTAPQVEALVMLVPQAVTSAAQPLFLPASPELFQAALVDWVLYRSYTKDQESATSFERGQAHLRTFMAYVGSTPMTQTKKATSPQRVAA